MYLFENGVGTKDEIYGLLEKAVKTDLENTTNGKALYTYFEMFVDKFEGGNSTYQLQDVFNLYDVISDKIDIETNKLSEELDELLKIEETQELNSRQERSKNRCVVNIESYEIIRTSMDSKIEKLATCDRLVPFLEKSYEENKTNEEWLNRAAARLYKKGCSDSSLFEKISDQLYNLNPTPQAAYNKGVNQMKKGNKTKALEFFNQAADLYKDVNKKADVYFTIANQVYGNSNKSQARVYCEKALQVKPSYDKSYLYIAQLYANSVNEAADDAFDKRAVYWLAAQTARKAGTSAGNAAAATYDKLAPSRQEIFAAGKSGQQICFKGWIGKCVTVPTL
jgi:tetratricopeptide (TPR) repeat protein